MIEILDWIKRSSSWDPLFSKNFFISSSNRLTWGISWSDDNDNITSDEEMTFASQLSGSRENYHKLQNNPLLYTNNNVFD